MSADDVAPALALECVAHGELGPAPIAVRWEVGRGRVVPQVQCVSELLRRQQEPRHSGGEDGQPPTCLLAAEDGTFLKGRNRPKGDCPVLLGLGQASRLAGDLAGRHDLGVGVRAESLPSPHRGDEMGAAGGRRRPMVRRRPGRVGECQPGGLHREGSEEAALRVDLLLPEELREVPRKRFLDGGELLTEVRGDPLQELPFLLQGALQAGVGRLGEALGDGGKVADSCRPARHLLLDPSALRRRLADEAAQVAASGHDLKVEVGEGGPLRPGCAPPQPGRSSRAPGSIPFPARAPGASRRSGGCQRRCRHHPSHPRTRAGAPQQ